MKTLKSYLRILPLVFLVLLLNSCKKNEGKVYLRVINLMPANASMTVLDKNQKIPIDGTYHQVYSFVETDGVLVNAVSDSVLNWTPSSGIFPVWKRNVSFSRYFGEFEKMSGDSYYTLTLNYKIEYSKPFTYSEVLFPNLKITRLTYSDNSNLVYSPSE
jgi:hypothetical protein